MSNNSGTIPFESWTLDITTTLKAWRDGDLQTLSESQLAHTDLIKEMLLDGEPDSKNARSRAVGWLLMWGIERLRPASPHSWLTKSWQHYNLLHHYYVEGWRVADVAEAFSIADQTFYEWRTPAVDALAKLLFGELKDQHYVEERQRIAIAQRFDAEPPAGKTLLRLLSFVLPSRQLSVSRAQHLLPNTPIADSVNSLSNRSLLQYDPATQGLRIHPQITPHAQLHTIDSERLQWQTALAESSLDEGDTLAAIHYLLATQQTEKAACLIVEQWQTLVDANQATNLFALLQPLKRNTFRHAPNVWAELQLIVGQLAETIDDLPAAIEAYGDAISASDLSTKAEAYYRRAKAYQRVDLDECISHYAVCIPLLLRVHADKPLSDELRSLITQMYIDRAWLFINERPDFERADADLLAASEMILTDDSSLWARLYNLRAELANRRGLRDEGIGYRQQAWVASQGSQQVNLMIKMANNLGTDLLWNKKNRRGLTYLQRALSLAIDADNLQMQGVVLKGIGNGHALEGRFADAVEQYLRAYAIFSEPRNPNYLTSTCIDLAEAYSEMGQWASARQYHAEGVAISAEMDHGRYKQELAELESRFPSLILNSSLSPRQQKVVTFVRENEFIRRPDYMTLIGVSKSQAHRDLEELCSNDILTRVGKGRATRYVLAQS